MGLIQQQGCITAFKDIVSVIQAIVTVAAIAIGGAWSYKIFIEQRQKYPHVKIEHHLTHKALPHHKTLLVLDIALSNAGGMLVSLPSQDVRVYQVLPLTPEILEAVKAGKELIPAGESEAPWGRIARHQTNWNGDEVIEPGESDQFHHEFVLDSGVSTVLVYSYFKNPYVKDKEIGWSLTTLYDMQGPDASFFAARPRRRGSRAERTSP